MLVENKAPLAPATSTASGDSALEQIPGFLHVTRRRELEPSSAQLVHPHLLSHFHHHDCKVSAFFTMCRCTSRTVQGEGEVEHAMFSGATSDDNAN